MAEFDLIERYLTSIGTTRDEVLLGVGDDAAIIEVDSRHDLVSATATMSACSAHTWTDRPELVGHRVLSTAINRLAASGTPPAWATLTLTLPDADETWLSDFCKGFQAVCLSHDISLVGGDTTRGPLCATVVVTGHVPQRSAIETEGTRPGDALLIAGSFGLGASAMLATAHPRRFDGKEREHIAKHWQRPAPVVAPWPMMRELAHASVDLTPGLSNALDTLLTRHELGANVNLADLPLTNTTRALIEEMRFWPQLCSFQGDHALCLSVTPENVARLVERFAAIGITVTEVGQVRTATDIQIHH